MSERGRPKKEMGERKEKRIGGEIKKRKKKKTSVHPLIHSSISKPWMKVQFEKAEKVRGRGKKRKKKGG